MNGTYAYTVLLLYPYEDPPQTYLAHVFSESPSAAVRDAREEAAAKNDGWIRPEDFDVLLTINSLRDDMTPEEFRP